MVLHPALTPLFTFGLAIAHRQERFHVQGLLGALIAVVGIGLVFVDQLSAEVPLVSLLLILVAAVAIAESSVIVKAIPRSDPFATNAVAMLTGGGLLLALSLVAGEAWGLPRQAETWAAVGYLVVFGSVVMFALFVFTLQRWTASAVSYVTLLMPLVTVALAAALTDERITPSFVLGGAVILAGVYVGAFMKGRPARSSASSLPECLPIDACAEAEAEPVGAEPDPHHRPRASRRSQASYCADGRPVVPWRRGRGTVTPDECSVASPRPGALPRAPRRGAPRSRVLAGPGPSDRTSAGGACHARGRPNPLADSPCHAAPDAHPCSYRDPGTRPRRGQRDDSASSGRDFLAARVALGESGMNTDMLIVANIHADGSRIDLISLPRDSVDVPLGDGTTWKGKINSLRAARGLPALKQAMSAALAIPIDYYAEMTMDDLSRIVNSIGGVTVTLAAPLHDFHLGMSWRAGANQLDGRTAVLFARSRFADSDYARAARNQLLLIALRDKLLGGGYDPLALLDRPSRTGHRHPARRHANAARAGTANGRRSDCWEGSRAARIHAVHRPVRSARLGIGPEPGSHPSLHRQRVLAPIAALEPGQVRVAVLGRSERAPARPRSWAASSASRRRMAATNAIARVGSNWVPAAFAILASASFGVSALR